MSIYVCRKIGCIREATNLILRGRTIKCEDELTYLELVIDFKMNWNMHVKSSKQIAMNTRSTESSKE